MNNSREVKDSLYEQFARVAKAVASPKRIELLDLLCQAERSVDGLARAANMTVKNASAQLKELRLARLVETRKEGTRVFYRLADDGVSNLYFMLRDIARNHLAEVDRIAREYFDEHDEFEPVGREDLLQRIQSGTAIVIDVRPQEEYAAGHIPGAISVPLAQLEERIHLFPEGVAVVAYCRGPYCVLAPEAMTRLRNAGFTALRLEEGFPEWKRAGLPVATGTKET